MTQLKELNARTQGLSVYERPFAMQRNPLQLWNESSACRGHRLGTLSDLWLCARLRERFVCDQLGHFRCGELVRLYTFTRISQETQCAREFFVLELELLVIHRTPIRIACGPTKCLLPGDDQGPECYIDLRFDIFPKVPPCFLRAEISAFDNHRVES